MTDKLAELRSRVAGERRTLTIPLDEVAIEVRADADAGVLHFTGHAAVFDRKTTIGSGPLSFTESVKRGFFRKALDEHQDVILSWDHDSRWTLGRTGAHNVELREDPRGLRVAAEIPLALSYARDLKVLLDQRIITGMSFAFTTREDKWSEETVDGTTTMHRDLVGVDTLYDVTVTAQPAYPQTDANARARRAASAATPDLEDDAEDDESLAEDLAEAMECLSDLLADDLDLFQSAGLAQPIADLLKGLAELLAEHVSDPVTDDDTGARALDTNTETPEGASPPEELREVDGTDPATAEAGCQDAPEGETRDAAGDEAQDDASDAARRRERARRLSLRV